MLTPDPEYNERNLLKKTFNVKIQNNLNIVTPPLRQVCRAQSNLGSYLHFYLVAITHIPLYWATPSDVIFWFCSLVLNKSIGNTHETPTMPAMPPFKIFGK